MSGLTTNLEVLRYMIANQTYYTNILVNVNQAGEFIENNKLFFYTYVDSTNRKKYSLNAYEILYMKRRMFLYKTEVEFYNDPIVQKYIQAYYNKFNILQDNNEMYQQFYLDYQRALFYSGTYGAINNSIYYKKIGLQGNFTFQVNPLLFHSIEQSEIKKIYTNEEIYRIYSYIVV